MCFSTSTYDMPDGSKLSAMTDQHKLYYHQLGTAQSEDKVILATRPQKSTVTFGATSLTMVDF